MRRGGHQGGSAPGLRILMVALEDPWSPVGGAALRTRGLASAAANLEVTSELRVLSFLPSGRRAVRLAAGLPDAAAGVEERERRGLLHESAQLRRGMAERIVDRLRAASSGTPAHLQILRRAAARRTLELSVAAFRPHIVQFEQLVTASLAAPLRRALADGWRGDTCKPRLVFGAHNLEHRIARFVAANDGLLHAFAVVLERSRRRAVRRLEQRCCSEFDAIIAVSEEEAQWFAAHTASPVFVVPNAVEIEATRRAARRPEVPTLLYCGHLGYPPNEAAAVELVREVLPRVRLAAPQARVLLAGRSPSRRVRRLAGPAVEVLASPPDDEFFDRASALVCPLRHGAGSRIKLLQAAAHHIPIVATEFAARGLALEAGRDYLAAESAVGLAKATVRLLSDPELCRLMRRQARSTVEEQHSWSRLAPRIGSIYEGLAGGHGEG